jgi:histidinol-phosphatase (PHP family)
MHCHFCRHAIGRIDEYARAAQAQGRAEICVTPHIPLPGFRPGFWGNRLRMDEREFDSYLNELEKTRAAFPDLTILSGVEADYIPSMENYLAQFLSRYTFDFVLMSVHFISTWEDDEWAFGFRKNRSLPSVYRDYFREMRDGIETGLFDCLAHLDLIKQPGKPVLATNREDVEEVLEACLAQGLSVEINTSGMRKEIAETYPCSQIIRLAIDKGVAIVTGSDAHAPSQVGIAFDQLESEHGESLKRRLVRYRKRKMEPMPSEAARASVGRS